MRYLLDEEKGDIRYEVEGDKLILKVKPSVFPVINVDKPEEPEDPEEIPNDGKPSSLWYPDKLKEYLRLNEDGTITILENPLRVKGNIYSDGDQIAFASTTDISEIYAIASPTNYGLVKIDGHTVKVNASGQLYTDVAGLDETALKKYLDDKSYITSDYLTTNKYITEDYITKAKYITLSSLLDGYTKPATYTAIAATDTLLSAFGKLDRRFDDYVDRKTDQTIGGIKTFTEDIRASKNIISDGDQIAFGSAGDITEVFAIASPTNYGLVKYDGVTIKKNADNQLYADVDTGGISGINPATGSGNVITSLSLSPDGRYVTPDKGFSAVNKAGDIMTGYLTVPVLISNVPTGTAPFRVSSTTEVANLNAQRLGGVMNGDVTARYMKVLDTRNDTPVPGDYASTSGVRFDFKANAAINLSDTGVSTFSGLMSFKPWGPSATDVSGGPMHQLAFNTKGLYHRKSVDASTFGTWTRLAYITDNVASATKLLYARTINGTSFDGTANIVTNTWGATRPFSIASHDFTNEGTAVNVNGFSKYVLPLPSTIKATLVGNASSATVATKLQTARKIWGQTFAGDGDVNGTLFNVSDIYMGKNNVILIADSSNVNRAVMSLNTTNDLAIGYGTALANYSTYICGGRFIYLNFRNSDGTKTDGKFTFTNAGRFGVNTSSPSATVDIVSTSNTPLQVTTNYAGLSSLFTGKNSKNATRFSIIENNTSVHLQYGGNSPVADIHRFAIQGTDGARLLKFDVAAKESVFSGDMAVGGNIKSDGDQIAFGSAGDITEVFAIASPTNYGLVKIDGSTIKIGADGRLYSEGGGSFGNIAFSGSGPFLSDVTPSADKKTLTFTRVGKPLYNVSEITNAVSTTDARLTNARPASDVYAWAKAVSKPAYTAAEVGAVSKYGDTIDGSIVVKGSLLSNAGNFVSRIVGTTGGWWERGLKWDNLDSSVTHGSVTMFGNASTPGYISIGFGMYNAFERLFVKSNGHVGIGTSSPLEKLHVWGNIRTEGNIIASSTALCPNLNADMIDGYHVARLMTMDNRGPGSIIADNTIASGYGFGYTADGWPTTGSYINFSGLSNVYPVQIQGAYQNSDTLRVRTRNGDTGSWNPFRKILTCDSDNKLTSSGNLKVGMISLYGNNEINCDSDLYLNNRGGKNIITNAGGGGLFARGAGLLIDRQSANSNSHIRLINSDSGTQWGIKAGNYMRNEHDFTITSDTDSLYPSLVLQRNSSSYGKMKLISLNTSECSIGYVNNNSTLENPAWVVGANTGSTGGFGWHSGAMGTNIMTLTNYDGLYLYRGWLRTSEDTGWYSQKWNGGIYMNDQNWVKILNKPLMCPFANSFGPSSFNVNLVVGQSTLPNSGMEFTSSNKIFGMGVHSNGNAYFWGGTNSYADGTSGKSYIGTINLANNQFSWYGLLLTNDDQVAFSDMRLKNKVEDYGIDIRDFVDTPLFTYTKKGHEGDGLRVGTSAQWMLDHMRLCVYGSEKEYYSYSYARGGFILGVSIIKRLVPWMDEKDKKIEELERRIRILESRQAS